MLAKTKDNPTLYSMKTFLSALVTSGCFSSSINFTKNGWHLTVLHLSFHKWSCILQHGCELYLSHVHLFCEFSVQMHCSFLSWGVNFSLLNFLYWPWCWERLRAGGEGGDRGWDGWIASLTQWTWVWVDSGSWWWTGRPGVLQSTGSQRVGHDWASELNWIYILKFYILIRVMICFITHILCH